MTRPFLTVPEELLEHAECAADGLDMLGFSISVERRELGQPYTPALACRRGRTRLIAEVMPAIDMRRIEDWVAYARSTGRDFRIAVVLPANAAVDAATAGRLKDLGVGLFRSHVAKLVEEFPAMDLGLNVALPDPKSIPRKVRPLLGPIYEQFDRSNWREGFGDACTVLEQEARKYMKAGMDAGRILLVDKRGKPARTTQSDVEGMTMGALVGAFAMIRSPNKTDSAVGEILARLNRDRVGEAHHKGRPLTEARLRKNVGTHMWTIVEGLRLLRG
ncbi:MAG TPA: hypothetical protein VEX88_00820 [Glaciibacter sp.]|nr:hypothetical protein [Glaciibacter sp.]